MDIIKNVEAGMLQLQLKGRLDTITAPQLEEEVVKSLDGVKEFVLDFTDLEYISSAGLRVLLLAQKKMNKQGSMVLKNVNDDIKGIFDITGFSSILDIQ